MKNVYIMVVILFSSSSLSKEWNKITVKAGQGLTNYIKDGGCNLNSSLIKEIKEKNPKSNLNKLKNGSKMMIPSCHKKRKIKEKSTISENGIARWEDIVAFPGYILSIDLEEKNCKNIWEKQIKLFMERNPKIKDPDVIEKNMKLTVQNCRELSSSDKKIILNSYLLESSMIEISLGKSFLLNKSGSAKTVNKEGYNVGLKYRSNLFGYSGFSFNIDMMDKTLALEPTLELRSTGRNLQYQMKIGSSHIISEEFDGNFTSFSGKVGFIYRNGEKVFEINAGVSIESKPELVFDLSFLKQVRENYIGIYAEHKFIYIDDFNSSPKNKKNAVIAGIRYSF